MKPNKVNDVQDDGPADNEGSMEVEMGAAKSLN